MIVVHTGNERDANDFPLKRTARAMPRKTKAGAVSTAPAWVNRMGHAVWPPLLVEEHADRPVHLSLISLDGSIRIQRSIERGDVVI